MSDDDGMSQKLNKIKGVPQVGGYFVKQSEEMIKSLEKENFNLKLKIFFLESKHGIKSTVPAELSKVAEKEYIDLFVENEALRVELTEKKDIMSNALEVIELLEKQKEEIKRESQAVINEQLKRYESLKAKSRLGKRKMLKNRTATTGSEHSNLKLKEELHTLKNQNLELLSKINEMKKENINKSTILEKLSLEKFQLLEQADQAERSQAEKDCLIRKLTEKIKEQASYNDLSKLLDDNVHLQQSVKDLSTKCAKLEREVIDYQRIIREQAEIMKAFNRTIEAKNDEIEDYKIKMELNDTTRFIQDDEINLNGTITSDTNVCQFPFHNPLFGSFQSLYR